jgi:hypothetical protein
MLLVCLQMLDPAVYTPEVRNQSPYGDIVQHIND